MRLQLKISTTLFFLFYSFMAFAQDDLPGDFEDGENPFDAPATPIEDYIWIAALLCLVYVFFKLKKRIVIHK